MHSGTKDTKLAPHAPMRRAARRDFMGSGTNKPVECLKAIFADTSIACLMRIAENNSMPGSLLEQLAYHSDPMVREAVADNPNTPIDTLWMLVNDECVDVRYALAENHNLPFAMLSSLSEDENPYVCSRAQSTIHRLLGARVYTGAFFASSDAEYAFG